MNLKEVLKRNFPWLGTDEEVSGADVVDALNDLYERSQYTMNERRIEWAAVAIQSFMLATNQTDHKEAAGDLVTNLLHWMEYHLEGEFDALNWLQGRRQLYQEELEEDE